MVASVSQIVSNTNALTAKSQALQGPAQSLTLMNGPLLIVGLGPFPQIITGFADIISTAQSSIGQMQGSAKITSTSDAKSVADAFTEFARINQVLLNILIGKGGLFPTVPVIGQPVAAILRQVEDVVDTFSFILIDLVSVKDSSSVIRNQQDSLRGTLDTAIKTYDGLSSM